MSFSWSEQKLLWFRSGNEDKLTWMATMAASSWLSLYSFFFMLLRITERGGMLTLKGWLLGPRTSSCCHWKKRTNKNCGIFGQATKWHEIMSEMIQTSITTDSNKADQNSPLSLQHFVLISLIFSLHCRRLEVFFVMWTVILDYNASQLQKHQHTGACTWNIAMCSWLLCRLALAASRLLSSLLSRSTFFHAVS